MTSPVSFGALRTFVEVGRHGSIKRAAFALNVTPGAVSQQIKALELRFGVQLLERGNREVRLSAHGSRLFGKIAPGFEQIDEAVDLFDDRRPATNRLVISTTPSFAACWLAPRLGRFTAQHPKCELRIETSVSLADLAGGAVDMAIRHGSGDDPGLDAALLFTPRLVAVASPKLLEHGQLRSPADCLVYPLLQDRDRADWPNWLEANGVRPTRNAMKGPSYADDALLVQAAMAGQGLAIVRDVYAAGAVETGAIMLAVDAPVATSMRYFVVVPPHRLTAGKIGAFRQWILREAGVV